MVVSELFVTAVNSLIGQRRECEFTTGISEQSSLLKNDFHVILCL